MKVVKIKTTITLETDDKSKFYLIAGRFGILSDRNMSIDLQECSDDEIAFLIRVCDVGLNRDCIIDIRLEK